MSTEPFIGEIKLFGFSFSPLGYSSCAGQLMSIAQNTALFSLLGTTYGGDGQTTFALPDFQGRVPIGMGQSGGTSDYTIGEAAGAESESLLTSNLPPHVHDASNIRVLVKSATAVEGSDPSGLFFGPSTGDLYGPKNTTTPVFMGNTPASGTTGISGSGYPFGILQPYLTLNYCIAVEGIFPSRN